MMKLTFLTANEFCKLEGESKPICAGFGFVGSNISAVKLSTDGNIYLKLSPIGDPAHNGKTIEIPEHYRTGAEIARLIGKEATK